MPIRKKNESQYNLKRKSDELAPKANNSLVFISHDSRDAELAEEFGVLLKRASSGALKSFSSSDKKGKTGIEYGQEWYPAIMEKIDEASDVVCLLTKHSIDRPWILYEAGVAKGKLNKKVIGIALGISLKTAISGPFAQFQNNDGDVDSITKLVLELIVKVPGLDPDQALVKQLVGDFIAKSDEINSRLKEDGRGEMSGNIDENSVAKLFEEVKIMFDSLPDIIESRIGNEKKNLELLKEKNKRLSEIAYRLSHNIRHPVANILGLLTLIDRVHPGAPLNIEIISHLENAASELDNALHNAIINFEGDEDLTITD